MSIEKIGQYGGFYNQYKLPEIRQTSVEEIQKQDEEIASLQREQSVATHGIEAVQPSNQAPRTAKLEDISLSFNVNETYDYIGKDADLQNLDMMSAISDMQKDKVLEQYQYFVGPRELEDSVVASTQDGIVIRK